MKWILAGCLVALVGALVACGDDDETADSDDERVSQIAGIAAAATYAYAATEGEGLLDYLPAEMAEKCTTDDIDRALADDPVPTGFKAVKDVEFDGDRATAIVVIMLEDGEEEQRWTFTREGDSWRVVELPSFSEEDCGG